MIEYQQVENLDVDVFFQSKDFHLFQTNKELKGLFTSFNDFFLIRNKEFNRSCVLVSDGLATFKFLSRIIRSSCKCLNRQKNRIDFQSFDLTVCPDRLSRQYFVLIQPILAENSTQKIMQSFKIRITNLCKRCGE